MKKLLFITLAAMAVMTSCKKEPAPSPKLSTDAPAAIVFSADGATAYDADGEEVTPTFTVTTNRKEWSAAVTPAEAAEWCSVAPDTGATGDTFTIIAAPNTSDTAPVAATVTITAGKAKPVTIAVTQSAPDQNDVYAAGSLSANGKGVATVWKNGEVLYTLSDGTTSVSAKEVFVSGGDVYTVGQEYNSTKPNAGKVWKNDELLYTIDNASQSVYVKSIFVSGGSVYVCGEEYNGADPNRFVVKVWKDGVDMYQDNPITDGTLFAYASSIFVAGSNNDVYVAGSEQRSAAIGWTIAKVWKNGVDMYQTNPLTPYTDQTRNASAYSVFVSGGSVYVAGFEPYGNKPHIARLWKDGEAQYTDKSGFISGINDYTARSVYVADGDVYVAGSESYDDNTSLGKVWKNGEVLYSLTSEANSTHANAVSTAGGNVYVGGYGEGDDDGSVGKVWKNGKTLYTFGDETTSAYVYSIFVVQRPPL